MTTYNGWTNYATWRVNLEFFDGVAASDHIGTGGRDRLASLMEALRDMVEAHISHGSNTGIARDYALAFIEEVNWREIAEHMLEGEEEEEEEEEEEGATLADPPATIEIECSPYMQAMIKAALGDN